MSVSIGRDGILKTMPCALFDEMFVRTLRERVAPREFGLITEGRETHGRVLIKPFSAIYLLRRKKQVAVKEKLRIKLKSYDHTLIDQASEKLVEAAKRNGAVVSGPIPLPTDKEIVTILRAVHKYKDSREQFELRTHKRLIDIVKPSEKVVEALTSLELPAGVEIEIKL